MMNPKRMNIIDIIIKRAPKNPRLAELEARLRSLEETGLPLPDIADFIESLDLVDRNELESALAGYLPVDYDFTSLIDSLSLVNQEHLDNALANYVSSYVENALEGFAKESALEGFATWTSLNTEVARLDSKIDNLDLSDYATKQELNDAVDAIDLSGFATKSQVNTEVQRLEDEIASISLQPSTSKRKDVRFARPGDLVMVDPKTYEYFTLDPSDYDPSVNDVDDNPGCIGVVSFPSNWWKGEGIAGGFMSFIHFSHMGPLKSNGYGQGQSPELCFRGTRDSLRSLITDSTSRSKCNGLETTVLVQESLARKNGSGGFFYVDSEENITTAANAGCFPAATAAFMQRQGAGFRKGPNTSWYLPSYFELLPLRDAMNPVNDTLSFLYDNTYAGCSIRELGSIMTCTESEQNPGKYVVFSLDGESEQWFDEPCAVIPMARLW